MHFLRAYLPSMDTSLKFFQRFLPLNGRGCHCNSERIFPKFSKSLRSCRGVQGFSVELTQGGVLLI